MEPEGILVMLIFHINILFLFLAYLLYIERKWVFRSKTDFWPTFTHKNGKYGQEMSEL